MQRKTHLVLSVVICAALFTPVQANNWFADLFSSSDDPGQSEFEKKLASPRDRVREHTTKKKGHDIKQHPLKDMYRQAWEHRSLENAKDLDVMLDTLWGQGASRKDMYRVLRTRQKKAKSNPEADRMALMPEGGHNEKLFDEYHALASKEQKRIRPIKDKKMANFLYKRARRGFLAEWSPIRRLYRMPSKSHAGLAALFSGLTLGGAISIRRIMRELDWTAKRRDVLFNLVLQHFGHVDKEKLAEALLNEKEPLSDAEKRLIRRFQLVDLEYRSSRFKLAAAALSLLGGGAGLAATFVSHVNRHPVAQWRESIEGTSASS